MDKNNLQAPEIAPCKKNIYTVDIGDNHVLVAKINRAGEMKKLGEAPYSPAAEQTDENYVNELADAIKKACVGFKGLFKKNAYVVLGGGEIITRVFTWPDMPYIAHKGTSGLEIAQYLQEDASKYIISHEVQARRKVEGGRTVIDTMVAAIPSARARAIQLAIKQAGFKLLKLDCRDNVERKGKLYFHADDDLSDALQSFSDKAAQDLAGKNVNSDNLSSYFWAFSTTLTSSMVPHKETINLTPTG